MYYGGESNVPGAPGNLMAGSPGYFMPEAEIQKRMQQRFGETPAGQQLQQNIQRVQEKYGLGPFAPGIKGASVPAGSSNLPGAVGNMGGIANAQFFEGPQLGQAAPQGEPGKPYGGAPNVPLTTEEKARLLQQGSPIPPNFREQYLPKADVPTGFQAKYVS